MIYAGTNELEALLQNHHPFTLFNFPQQAIYTGW